MPPLFLFQLFAHLFHLLGEGGGNVGRGSAYATILFILCFGFVIWYVTNHYRNTQEGADS